MIFSQHPDHYFTDDINELSTDNLDDDDDDDDFTESVDDYNNQTVDTALSSVSTAPDSLLKTVHNGLVYCLGCNHLHSSTEECKKPFNPPNSLPPLKRDPNNLGKKEKTKSRTAIDRSVKYSLSNETQTDASGRPTDTLILRRVPIPTSKVIVQQPTTKIMIVRVPKVTGELIIQPKEH